jgi:hypothetical protein
VKVEDLKDPWRLAALFKQARLRGWVQKTEADILAVFTAAAHATRVGIKMDALFRWILQNQAWQVASHVDENMARIQLHRIHQTRAETTSFDRNIRKLSF